MSEHQNALGQFVPGNRAALKHGLYSSLDEALREEHGRFLEQSIADDGGRDEVPERRRSLHAYRAKLHIQIVRLAAALDERGLFDRKGKLRAIWLGKLESMIREARSIDSTLGLDRRPRPVEGVKEWLDGARA